MRLFFFMSPNSKLPSFHPLAQKSKHTGFEVNRLRNRGRWLHLPPPIFLFFSSFLYYSALTPTPTGPTAFSLAILRVRVPNLYRGRGLRGQSATTGMGLSTGLSTVVRCLCLIAWVLKTSEPLATVLIATCCFNRSKDFISTNICC